MSTQSMVLLVTVLPTAAGLALIAAAIVYRIIWRRRYGPLRLPPGLLRTRGRLPGGLPPRRGTFELVADDGRALAVRLDDGVELPATGSVRAGQRVTVEGFARAVPLPAGEALYRDQGLVSGLDATRLLRGAWPPLRWLLPAAGGLGLALIVSATQLDPEGGSLRHWIVRRSAAETRCGAGTTLETKVGPEAVLHRCRDARGRLHGPYTTWNWAGQLVEHGTHRAGRLHGSRTRVLDDGRIEHATFHLGELHGPLYILDDRHGDARRSYHADYERGQLHGLERSWHPGGQRAFVRFYWRGRPYGTWTYWDERGQVLSLREMTASNAAARDFSGHML